MAPGHHAPVPEKENNNMEELKELSAELENEEYEDDDWFMDDDDPDYGLPGIDPDYEEWLCDIGEDPWGGHW